MTVIPSSLFSYDIVLPYRIVFGCGRRREIGNLTRSLGNRAILVQGSRTLSESGLVQTLIDDLQDAGIPVLITEILSHEPETKDVDQFVRQLRPSFHQDDFVLSLGGGAAIDLGKAVAALLPQPDWEDETVSVKDYLEGVGTGRKLHVDPLPFLAMPTTAGTGSEATKNAVISSYEPAFKKSLRDDRIMARLVLVDPEWTVSCSDRVTVESGMDAMTQLFESYVSRRRQPITDSLAEQGLLYAWEALPKVHRSPDDLRARTLMSHAALLSGITLANAGLGMAHGVAPALGTHCHVSHGAACALMLPSTLRTNADVCGSRYARLGRLLLRLEESTPEEKAVELLIGEVDALCERLGTPRRLSDLGIDRSVIPALARDSKGSSMSGNPKELSEQDVVEILNEIA